MADPSPFTDRMNAADERARRLLKEHGSVDSLRQATGDSWLTLRARAVQAEDELQALHTRLSNETGNPVTVYEQERQALLDEIGRLTDIAQRHEENAKGRVGEYQRLLADYQALQAKVADYQDMPDPQETRRRMDVLSQELHHVQETLATSQKKVTELLDEKHRAEDLIQNLKSNLSKGGRFTDEQVLELLMPLARRVHGLESKLFEQAGIFP